MFFLFSFNSQHISSDGQIVHQLPKMRMPDPNPVSPNKSHSHTRSYFCYLSHLSTSCIPHVLRISCLLTFLFYQNTNRKQNNFLASITTRSPSSAALLCYHITHICILPSFHHTTTITSKPTSKYDSPSSFLVKIFFAEEYFFSTLSSSPSPLYLLISVQLLGRYLPHSHTSHLINNHQKLECLVVCVS